MKRLLLSTFLLMWLGVLSTSGWTQYVYPQIKKPAEKVIAEARSMVDRWFEDLRSGKSEKNGRVDGGSAWLRLGRFYEAAE